MTATINNFWGAETNGLEECSATSGGASVSAGSALSGGYGYDYGPSFLSYTFSPFESVADAAGDYICGFKIYATDYSTLGDTLLITFLEGATVGARLELKNSGDLWVLDANLSLIRTITAPFTDSTEHFVEIYWQHVASGTIEVFVDGVSQGSDSAQDLTDGGTFDGLSFSSNANGLTGGKLDDIYFMSGCTSSADRLGGCNVYAYRSSLASATGDSGTVLDSGTWANAQEVPFSETNVAAYTASTADAGYVLCNDVGGSAGTGGPNTDTNITGRVVATKGIWRMKRTGGGATVHYGLLGNDTDGGAHSYDLDPTTGYVNYFDVHNIGNNPWSSTGAFLTEKQATGVTFEFGKWSNQDGTFVYSRTTQRFSQWPLSTPYDISTLGTRTTVTEDPNKGYGMWFADNGKYLFFDDYTTALGIVRWELSTPYDITTKTGAAQIMLYSAFSGGSGSTGLCPAISEDGTTLLMLMANADTYDLIEEWTFTTAFDLTGGFTYVGAATSAVLQVPGAPMQTSQDGKYIFIEGRGAWQANNSEPFFFLYRCTTPWTISTLKYIGTYYPSVPASAAQYPIDDIGSMMPAWLRDNGKMMFVTWASGGAEWFIEYAADGSVPILSETLVIGFEKDDGGQDFNCSDMLAQVLHAPALPTRSFPPYNPYKLMHNFLVR